MNEYLIDFTIAFSCIGLTTPLILCAEGIHDFISHIISSEEYLESERFIIDNGCIKQTLFEVIKIFEATNNGEHIFDPIVLAQFEKLVNIKLTNIIKNNNKNGVPFIL